MLGHSKRSFVCKSILSNRHGECCKSNYDQDPNNGSPLADLSDICKPDIDNIVEKTYSSVIPKRIINDCQL